MEKNQNNVIDKKDTQGEIREGQIKNSSEAAAFPASDKTCLDRFLILGSEGGSYYAKEKKLTLQNVDKIKKMIKNNGVSVVNRVKEISNEGRAHKNDPALLVWAMCVAYGDEETRKAAYEALPTIARIGTDLFHAIDFVKNLKKTTWSRGLRTAVSRWYNDKDIKNISFLVGKYGQRDGWSNRDLIRLAHPKPKTEKHQILYKWIEDPSSVTDQELKKIPVIWAKQQIIKLNSNKRIISLIKKHNLSLEFIPTEKRTREVYEEMLSNFGITALIRNLGKLTELGIFDNTQALDLVCKRLTDQETLIKKRVHPMTIITAFYVYRQGRGVEGKLSWNPVTQIIDALNDAFYLSFKSIVPTGQRYMLALDVSDSMTWEKIAGTPINPREASAIMAMVTARTEKNYTITAFSGSNWRSGKAKECLSVLNISPKQRLDAVIDKISTLPAGGTDCSAPMRWALENKKEFDTFIIYTDNETNRFNTIDPSIALKKYREKMGIDAKLIVVGMVSNGFTIADPNDKGMLDVCGFDSATPNIISQFSDGKI